MSRKFIIKNDSKEDSKEDLKNSFMQYIENNQRSEKTTQNLRLNLLDKAENLNFEPKYEDFITPIYKTKINRKDELKSRLKQYFEWEDKKRLKEYLKILSDDLVKIIESANPSKLKRDPETQKKIEVLEEKLQEQYTRHDERLNRGRHASAQALRSLIHTNEEKLARLKGESMRKESSDIVSKQYMNELDKLAFMEDQDGNQLSDLDKNKLEIEVSYTYTAKIDKKYLENLIDDAMTYVGFAQNTKKIKEEKPIGFKGKKPKWFTEQIMSGWKFTFVDIEDSTMKGELSLETIKKAIQIMALKYPHLYKSVILKEDYDAMTSGALLEIAVFGEVVYA